MSTHQLLMAELEQLLRGGMREKRVATLGRMTDFFLTGIEMFSDEQIDLFDDVLLRLIDDIESTVLIELANTLAPIDRAPVNVIGHLARHGEIMVAAPVLTRSSRLKTKDLVEIAGTGGQEHLLAISLRARIESSVTEALVQRGNEDVLLSVTRNAGASFSHQGFATLVTRAEGNDLLGESVGLRPDLPVQLFERLLLHATRIVRHRLVDAGRGSGHPEISRVLATVAHEIGIDDKLRRFDAAQRTVSSRRQAGSLDEAAILEFARANSFEELVVGLSAMCSVPPDVVDRLMNFERSEAMLVPCRAAGLSWATVREVIRMHARDRAIPEPTMQRSRENYEKLTRTTATRILKFWQSRLAGRPRPPATAAGAGATASHAGLRVPSFTTEAASSRGLV